MTETVPVPTRLDLADIAGLAIALEKAAYADTYVFDFSQLSYAPPFGLLKLGAILRQFKAKRMKAQGEEVRFRVANHHGHDYVAHMGFFKSFGVDYGKDPGEASGSERYLPITAVPVNYLEEQATAHCVPVGEVVEGRAHTIATILTQQEDGDLVKTLTYCLREIIRNVVEHSLADHVWYCAQFWPKRDMVEVAVLDEGIGVRQSLAANPHLHIDNDETAIKLSLLPGISGRTFKVNGRLPRSNQGVWQNSGYGLYMTSSICQRGGNFAVCSGTASYCLAEAGNRSLSTCFAGTALRLRLKPSRMVQYEEMLAEIRDRGHQIAKESAMPGNLTASRMSTMLRLDTKTEGTHAC